MFGAWTEACKGLTMLCGAVSFVACKPVLGKALAKLDHETVPPYFSHNGRGRDGEHALISAGDRLLGDF